MGSVIYDSGNHGWYLSGTNANMVALMKTLGVKSIRVGGNSAESGNIATSADEDAALDFCHAIGGNLIWDLEVKGSLYDPPGKAVIAQSMQNYVTSKNYGANILVFQVGNEPDLVPDPYNPGHNMGVTTYDLEFSNYIAAVNGLYSGSRWAGPDCAGGGAWFSGTFCPAFAPGGQVAFVCQHLYPFGSSLDTNTSAVHISWMLAASVDAGYQSFNNRWVPSAFAAGLAPRYEECNSFFHNGSFGASDTYASALWGLDWMYFQANVGLAGINLHMGLNANNPAYSAITPANLTASYTVHPLAYAIAAFNLGGHGKIVPMTVGNPSSANVVAYSVLQNDGSLMLTVINREYVSQPSPPAHNAALAISTSGTAYNDGQVMFLTGMNNDPATTTGVTLGGSPISGSGVWTGTYMGMAHPSGSSFALTVPAAQAAIIHLFNAAGPAAPTNLTTTTGNSQVTLTWSNSIGANGYVVQRSGTTGGPYATIAGGVTTNSYTDTGLTNGSSYYYVVAATNSSGIGPQSAEAVAALANLPPIAPTGLTAAPGNTVVFLNWNVVFGATNYVVLSSTNSGGPYSTNVSTTTTGYLNTGLSNGTTYYYVVFATSPYGQSPLSTEVSATPFIGSQFLWTNTITSAAQDWNTAANWSNGVAFPNNAQAVAIINSAISANQTINLNQTVTIGELDIGASGSAASFTLAGNGGALTLNNSPGTAAVLQLASSKGDTISAPMNVNGDLNVDNSSANALTLSGGVASTNNLLVNSDAGDTGTVILGGVNTFAGASIAQGTLQLANSLALQNTILNYTSGNLGFNGITSATLGGLNGTQNLGLVNVASTAVALTIGNVNSNMTYSGSFTGSGSLTKVGTGTLILNGTNTKCGNVTVTGGILQLNGGSMSNAAMTVSGGTAIQFYIHGGSFNSSALSTVGASSSTGGTFLEDGGVANFNGGIQMANNSGTDLRINNGVFTASSITVPKSYTGVGVNFNDGLIFNGGTATVSGNILLANNSSEASMSVGGGAVTVGGNIILGQQTSVGRGGHLQVTSGSLTDLDAVNGLVFISPTAAGQSSTATFSGGVSSVPIIKFGLNSSVGAGNIGTLTLNGGTLYVGSGGITNPGVGMTCTILLTNGILGATADWSSSLAMTLGGVVIQAEDAIGVAHNITLNGVLSGNAGLTKTGAGDLTLGGTNTYSGGTTITEGTLQIGGGGTSGILGAGNVTDSDTLAFNRSDSITDTNFGVITGAGNLAKLGTGRLTLTKAHSYIGATLIGLGILALTNSGSIANSYAINISDGALFDVSGRTGGSMSLASGQTISGYGSVKGNFTIGSGAVLAPGGSIGTLTFSNSLTLASGSLSYFEISKSPLTNDVARIFGALTNGGTLVVTNIGAAPLASGDSFKLFNAASYNGAFANVILPPLSAGLGWNTNSLNTNGTLSVVVVTKPFITSAVIFGNGFAFTGTSGVANANFYLLGSTNLATPLTNWTRFLTNQFDSLGNFNFTNPLDPNSPQTFYLLQLP